MSAIKFGESLSKFMTKVVSSVYVFSYFPFGFEDRMWDLIGLVPDHCLSFYFTVDRSSPGIPKVFLL